MGKSVRQKMFEEMVKRVNKLTLKKMETMSGKDIVILDLLNEKYKEDKNNVIVKQKSLEKANLKMFYKLFSDDAVTGENKMRYMISCYSSTLFLQLMTVVPPGYRHMILKGVVTLLEQLEDVMDGKR